MDKEFVPWIESKELKALGFNEECFAVYNSVGVVIFEQAKRIRNSAFFWTLTAPLWQQVFRWFRENYMLSSSIIPHTINHSNETMEYSYNIHGNYTTSVTLGTYEEAELACLRKLISIVKSKSNG